MLPAGAELYHPDNAYIIISIKLCQPSPILAIIIEFRQNCAMDSLENEPWTDESRIRARAEKILAIFEEADCSFFLLPGVVCGHERAIAEILREEGIEVIIPLDN